MDAADCCFATDKPEACTSWACTSWGTPQEEIETAGTKTEIAYKYIVPEIMLDDNGSPVVFVQNLEILVSEIRVIPEEFGGILGLDFFEDKKICLDLLNGRLDIT